jgi:hypothetical protein
MPPFHKLYLLTWARFIHPKALDRLHRKTGQVSTRSIRSKFAGSTAVVITVAIEVRVRPDIPTATSTQDRAINLSIDSKNVDAKVIQVDTLGLVVDKSSSGVFAILIRENPDRDIRARCAFLKVERLVRSWSRCGNTAEEGKGGNDVEIHCSWGKGGIWEW